MKNEERARRRWPAGITRETWARDCRSPKTPEQMAAHIARSWAGYKAKNPARAIVIEATQAAIRSGVLPVEPCDRCGGEARPLYDWSLMRHSGWRCLRCRRS